MEFSWIPYTPEDIKRLDLPKHMNEHDFRRWQLVNHEVQSKEAIGMPCEVARNERFGIIARYVNAGRHI